MELFTAAMETSDVAPRLELLHESLRHDPYCVPALVEAAMLSDDRETRLSMLGMAVSAGLVRHGPPTELPLEEAPDLTETVEGEYLTVAILEVALIELRLGRLEAAAEALRTSLMLHPADSHGARYFLLGTVLALQERQNLEAMLNIFDDQRTTFRWARVLERFLAGDHAAAAAALAVARGTNAMVEPLILGQEAPPDEPPVRFYDGTAADARNTWYELRVAFERHPAFGRWLAAQPLPDVIEPVPIDWSRIATPALRDRYHAIVAVTDAFCEARLTADYAEICRRLAASLCQPGTPAERGQVASWAAAVVAAVAGVNLLDAHDPDYGLTQADVAAACGVGASTLAAKLRAVREFVELEELSPQWTPHNLLLRNPRVWLLDTDRLPMDARLAPLEVQRQAADHGLIPFVPGESGTRVEDLGGSWTKLMLLRRYLAFID